MGQTVPVTVIIPTFERPDYLVRILDALAHGTVNPLEVIVVDSSADPSTAYRIADLEGLPFSLLYLKRPPTGFVVASSRNYALKLVKGDIVLGIQDATLPCLALVDEHYKLQSSAEGCAGLFVIGYVRNNEFDPDSDDRHTSWDASKPWARAWGRNFSVRYDVARKVTWDESFDGAYGFEDVDFAYRIFQMGVPFVVSKEAYCIQLSRKHTAPGQIDQGLQLWKFANKHGVLP